MEYGTIITLLFVIVLIVVFLILITSIRTRLVALDGDVISALSQLGVHMSTYTDSLLKLLDRVIEFCPDEGNALREKLVRGDHMVVGSSRVEDILRQERLFSETCAGIEELAKASPDLNRDFDYNRLSEDLSGVGKMVEISVKIYNSAAMKFNSNLEHFPEKCIVGLLGYRHRNVFDSSCLN